MDIVQNMVGDISYGSLKMKNDSIAHKNLNLPLSTKVSNPVLTAKCIFKSQTYIPKISKPSSLMVGDLIISIPLLSKPPLMEGRFEKFKSYFFNVSLNFTVSSLKIELWKKTKTMLGDEWVPNTWSTEPRSAGNIIIVSLCNGVSTNNLKNVSNISCILIFFFSLIWIYVFSTFHRN